jgi:Ser/Thr protein kinase RdoA (MazF antagonist)
MPSLASSPRRPYESLPAQLRAWVDAALGAPVVQASTQTGGFSAGVAARIRTADGNRAFIKAVGPDPNPDTPGLFRTELAALQALASAELASLTAPLLAGYDDGEHVALLLTDIDGQQPAQPFHSHEVALIGTGLDLLADALSRTQIDLDLPRLADGPLLDRWRHAHDKADRAGLAQLDPWLPAHLDTLLDLAAHARTALAGSSLLHFDIRSDNILLTGAGQTRRAVFVDWAWLRRGARWCDAALFAYDLATSAPSADRPIDPDAFVTASATLRDVPARDLTSMVAVIAGAMVAGSLKAPPPGLPTMRTWQARMARGGLAWLRRRIDAGLS